MANRRGCAGIAQVDIGKPLVYHIGAGWTRSGDFPDASAWTGYLRESAGCLEAPLRVETAP
jgi:unsaturated rhamnogalacturonyl hydrolase